MDTVLLDNVILELQHNSFVPGIDKIGNRAFSKGSKLFEYRKSVSDAIEGKSTYKFSKYKELLKVKDADSKIRVLSIPCCRDRIMLKYIHGIILKDKLIKRESFSSLISSINTEINGGSYDSYLITDLISFFDNIKIDLLLEKLGDVGFDKTLIPIIETSLKTITINPDKNTRDTKCLDAGKTVGIPQGIIISNDLAEIYIQDVEKDINLISGVKFFRFVDDILILFDSKKISGNDIYNKLKFEVSKINLQVHEISDKKTTIGSLKDNLNFLGFLFKNGKISAGPKTIKRVEKSFERIIFDFKNSSSLKIKDNYDFFNWKMNLAIAGMVNGKNKYGWIFTYKNCDDLTIYYRLDDIINKMIERAKLDLSKINIKKLSKAHFYVANNNYSYCAQIDKDYSDILQRKNLLINVFKFDDIPDERVNELFNKVIKKQIYDIERDLDLNFSK